MAKRQPELGLASLQPGKHVFKTVFNHPVEDWRTFRLSQSAILPRSPVTVIPFSSTTNLSTIGPPHSSIRQSIVRPTFIRDLPTKREHPAQDATGAPSCPHDFNRRSRSILSKDICSLSQASGIPETPITWKQGATARRRARSYH
jgi:hypothetical protein